MQPTTGDRVRITRYRPDGAIRFIKTGTILRADSWYGFSFSEDAFGGSRFVSSCAALADLMPGWTQAIELLTKED